jgi:hypothetical protein
MQYMTKEQRAARDADFKAREKPRMLWSSTEDGPAIRVDTPRGPQYRHKPVVAKKSGARKLTEKEDNAIGRALRRRQNKRAPWLAAPREAMNASPTYGGGMHCTNS